MSRTRNLQIALTVLSIGFALEAGVELYSLLSPGATTPGVSVLFVLPLVIAGVGLIFVWIGRAEWNDVHRSRARTAGHLFAVSLVGVAVAVLLLALLLLRPSIGTPLWAQVVFGAAVGSLVFGTFVVYAYLVYHLASTLGHVAIILGLVWALGVSILVSIDVARNLTTVLATISNRSFAIPLFVAPVDLLVCYLFLSFLLLLAASIEAHTAVYRGLVVVSARPAAAVTREPEPPK